MKIGIIIVKFIFIGALFIVSNQNLHLLEFDDRQEFYDYFGNWMEGIYDHSLEITGYVLNSEWLPEPEDRLTRRRR